MICGILLAGGEGRRFGGDKLAARLDDDRSVLAAAAAAIAGAVDCRILVTRPGRDTLTAPLAAAGWRVIATEHARRGMGASLAAGVRACPDADGYLIALGDMPALRPATAAAVVDALRAGAWIAAPVVDGRRGHPVGFRGDFAAELMSLDGDEGARSIVKRANDHIIVVEVNDHGALLDVDRPSDLEALTRVQAGSGGDG